MLTINAMLYDTSYNLQERASLIRLSGTKVSNKKGLATFNIKDVDLDVGIKAPLTRRQRKLNYAQKIINQNFSCKLQEKFLMPKIFGREKKLTF